jgi:hypothetical protein
MVWSKVGYQPREHGLVEAALCEVGLMQRARVRTFIRSRGDLLRGFAGSFQPHSLNRSLTHSSGLPRAAAVPLCDSTVNSQQSTTSSHQIW